MQAYTQDSLECGSVIHIYVPYVALEMRGYRASRDEPALRTWWLSVELSVRQREGMMRRQKRNPSSARAKVTCLRQSMPATARSHCSAWGDGQEQHLSHTQGVLACLKST
jgi:hypothetical protein